MGTIEKQKKESLILMERIINKIFLIRGEKVMIDRDLAELYGVGIKVLNQAVRRNIGRFPGDFMFQMSGDEMKNWRSQFVTLNRVMQKLLDDDKKPKQMIGFK